MSQIVRLWYGMDNPTISRKKTAGGRHGDGVGHTPGYAAPELGNQWERAGRKRKDFELIGHHTDVYALGRTIEFMAGLIQAHVSDGDTRVQFFGDDQGSYKLTKFYSQELPKLSSLVCPT